MFGHSLGGNSGIAGGSSFGGGALGGAGDLAQGLGQLFSGLFFDSSEPYKEARKHYESQINKGVTGLNPFYRGGTEAIQNQQNALAQMQDPSKFLNNLISQYQQSPYNQFLQQQGQRALTNQASAAGLTGSTPYQQAGIDYANKISQQGLDSWLGQVLGLNTQYLQDNQNLANTGLTAAQSQASLYGQSAPDIANLRYGQEAGDQYDFSNILGGLGRAGVGAARLYYGV